MELTSTTAERSFYFRRFTEPLLFMCFRTDTKQKTLLLSGYGTEYEVFMART